MGPGPVGIAIPSNYAPAAYASWIGSYNGNVTAERVFQGAQLAASLAATYVAYRAYERYSDKQKDMLDRQLQIVTEQYDRYTGHYALCEDSLTDEYCAIPTYTPQYAVQAARARAAVQKAFDRSRAQLLKCRGRFCTGQTAEQLNDLAVSQALVEAGYVTMAFRYEESRVDYKNQIRHDRRYAMFSLAKGIPTMTANVLGSQAGTFGGMSNQAQAAFSNGLASVFNVWGSMISSNPARLNGVMGQGSHYSAGGSNAYPEAPMGGRLSPDQGYTRPALGSTPRMSEGSGAVQTFPYIP